MDVQQKKSWKNFWNANKNGKDENSIAGIPTEFQGSDQWEIVIVIFSLFKSLHIE